MPKIVQDENILAAARNAIEILLKFKGQQITLSRKGTAVRKPSGGHDFQTAADVPAQLLALSRVGGDELLDGDNGETPVVKRHYVLTGRHDASVRADDTWSDAEADYRVESVDDSSGFKVQADVVGFVKVGA